MVNSEHSSQIECDSPTLQWDSVPTNKSINHNRLLYIRLLSVFVSFIVLLHPTEAAPSNETVQNRRVPVSVPSTVVLPTSRCPQVLGCKCEDENPTRVFCSGVGHREIDELSRLYSSLSFLSITEWSEDLVDLNRFAPLSSLSTLSINKSQIYFIVPLDSLKTKALLKLKEVSLTSSGLSNYSAVCNLTHSLPFVRKLDLHANNLGEVSECPHTWKQTTEGDSRIEDLDLSNNKISLVAALPASVKRVNLSGNLLKNISTLPSRVERVDLSSNPLDSLNTDIMTKLRWLNISSTNFAVLPELNAPRLETLVMDKSVVGYADYTRWKIPALKQLSMKDSSLLELVYGSIPKTVSSFSLTNSKLSTIPRHFFEGLKLTTLNLTGNQWDCSTCMLPWTSNVAPLLGNSTNCSLEHLDFSNCSIGCSADAPDLIRARNSRSAILPCGCYGDPDLSVEWWLYRPKMILGRYFANNGSTETYSGTENMRGKFEILKNGLNIISADKTMVERYVCVVKNEHGHAYRIVRFRLDYSNWYSFAIFDSVFWGSCLTSLLVCAFSFLLNVTWILSRKSILWWIHRAERLSRVRKMVEAMEKYRARQMESLHEKYARKVQNVRENYHQQVEQLREAYSSQAERFREYREAQMENVTSHLEVVRDNYNQQMQRVREYGSRRAEQLWESYERQVNRMRTFSLQHRLKLMRQYKVKQRYLNKLLESFQDTNSPEALRQHEEEVRAALDALKTNPLDDVEDPQALVEGTHSQRDDPPGTHGVNPLSRASSFYSLPEYTLDENGDLRPTVLPTIRFHQRDETANSAARSNWHSNVGGSRSAHPTPKRRSAIEATKSEGGSRERSQTEVNTTEGAESSTSVKQEPRLRDKEYKVPKPKEPKE